MTRIGAGRRYARAAFELAERDRTIDAWGRDLALAAGLGRDERVARAVDSPAVPFGRRREAVERLLGKNVSRGALNLALLLAKRGRFAILPDVSAEYDALVRESRGVVAATVTTSAPLSEKELAGVRARVEQMAGAKAELTTATDPRLLGGLTVRIGDRLIDASVRGRLERLRGRLVQGTS
ncbi:MAG: ATP synthase F1 subunit delta [Candidatus Limnocylindrales bacterium]